MINAKLPAWAKELFQPCRYKIMYGGRGSAKSYSVAIVLLLEGMQCRHRILCAREFQNSIGDSVIRLLGDLIQSMGLEYFYEVQRDRIIGANGTEFIFKGIKHNVQSIKSLAAITRCWVEEGQVISEESWSVLIPTIREPGSEIWITMNPYRESDPTHQRFIADPPPSSWVKRVNFVDNPWFPEELRDEMEWDKSRDHDKYLHIWEGECVQHSESRVFNNWIIRDFDAPEDVTFYYGADWGFSVDPTTLLRCYADHDNRVLYFDHEAYKVGVEIDDTPELFDVVPYSRKWPITADSARPETISYMRRHGFNIRGAKKGKGSVEDGVEFLKSYNIVVHSRCKHLIDELRLYSYKTDRMTGEVLPVLEDKNNHCIDAARYAMEKLAFNRVQIHIG